ncbi:MAG: dehydrogenase, partial [Verrucomicrobiota bacterium]
MKTPLLALAIVLGVSHSYGLNKGNAGPAEVSLKFKLPAPAPLSPEEELKTFKIAKGFRIELVASEPMIESPVAISFDDQGRMFVVEMRSYMRDLEGTTENDPTSRVSLLTDTDGDGRMDKASAFLDNLVMPRGVMAVKGGAFVAEPPNLFFCRDTKGTGVADEKILITSDFGKLGGQPEHMANTPTWAMDNRVYAAGYSTSLKLTNGAWQKGPGLGRGQWGLSQDDAGRLFYNYNSDLLRTDLLPAAAYARNPLLRDA